MSGLASKRKGERGEREVVELAKAHGFTHARRNFGSGSQGGGDLTGIPGLCLEVKRQERIQLQAWWRQAMDAAAPGEAPALAIRWSGGPALGVIELDELFALWSLKVLA